MQIIKPPDQLDHLDSDSPIVFLAGSIEMGTAVEWQNKVETELRDFKGTILNPRRDDWDSSWTQSIDNDQFRNQVEWELRGLLDCASHVFFYFAPETKSPISLMELGLIVGQNSELFFQEIIVVCPNDFWRKGNVDVLCNQFGVDVYPDLESGIAKLKQSLPNVKINLRQ